MSPAQVVNQVNGTLFGSPALTRHISHSDLEFLPVPQIMAPMNLRHDFLQLSQSGTNIKPRDSKRGKIIYLAFALSPMKC
jgi:hypothetical protein